MFLRQLKWELHVSWTSAFCAPSMSLAHCGHGEMHTTAINLLIYIPIAYFHNHNQKVFQEKMH